MIGGLADWYAVVALFKLPPGPPIPHTAIIQSDRGRIADKFIDQGRLFHDLVPGGGAQRSQTSLPRRVRPHGAVLVDRIGTDKALVDRINALKRDLLARPN